MKEEIPIVTQCPKCGKEVDVPYEQIIYSSLMIERTYDDNHNIVKRTLYHHKCIYPLIWEP